MGHCKIFLCSHQNKLAMLISVTTIKVKGWLGNIALLQFSALLNIGI